MEPGTGEIKGQDNNNNDTNNPKILMSFLCGVLMAIQLCVPEAGKGGKTSQRPKNRHLFYGGKIGTSSNKEV